MPICITTITPTATVLSDASGQQLPDQVANDEGRLYTSKGKRGNASATRVNIVASDVLVLGQVALPLQAGSVQALQR